MEKIFIFIAIVSVLTGVSTLQCYRCTNCPTVKSDDIVTCGSNTTMTTTSPPVNTSTTVQPPVNTTETPGNATATPSTPTANSTTDLSNSTTNSTNQNNTLQSPESIRVRRNVADDCLCNNGICDCNGLQFNDLRASETYVCVTDTVTINGTSVINRGCAVKKNSTSLTCVQSAFSNNCNICETDTCNDASSRNFSVLVILTSFFLALKLN